MHANDNNPPLIKKLEYLVSCLDQYFERMR